MMTLSGSYITKVCVFYVDKGEGMQKLEGGISGHKNKKLRMEEVSVNSSDWLELFVIIAWII